MTAPDVAAIRRALLLAHEQGSPDAERAEAALDALVAERDAARATARRLNRRAQAAERRLRVALAVGREVACVARWRERAYYQRWRAARDALQPVEAALGDAGLPAWPDGGGAMGTRGPVAPALRIRWLADHALGTAVLRHYARAVAATRWQLLVGARPPAVARSDAFAGVVALSQVCARLEVELAEAVAALAEIQRGRRG